MPRIRDLPNTVRYQSFNDRREYLLIDGFFSLTPKEREIAWHTISSADRKILTQAESDDDEREPEESEWVRQKTTMKDDRCDKCRRVGRWKHPDGRLRCQSHLEDK